MINTSDQLGRSLTLAHSPQRIVSLVPSLTELLCDLGLRDRLVGCTKFCVHPADLRRQIAVVGGTKRLRTADLLALQPDFILANKEENTQDQVESLAAHCPTWVSDVPTLAAAEDMIQRLAALFDRLALARSIIARNRAALPPVTRTPPRTALYLIWRQPYMTVGYDTYIHDVMQHCGLQNVCGHGERYPSVSTADISQLAPDVLLLSSEPYPFRPEHRAELQALCPAAQVQLVDGEYFSWYGSRLGKLANGYLLSPD